MHQIKTLWKHNRRIFIYGGLVLVSYLLGILGIQHYLSVEVKIKWSTASEVNTAGYNIYRSDPSDVNLKKINLELIKATKDPFAGGNYSYHDLNVEAGRIYHYQLEEVDIFGKKTQYGSVDVEAKRDGQSEIAISVVLGCIGIIGIFSPVNKPPSGIDP